MTLNEALLKYPISPTWLAAQLGVSRQIVYIWQSEGWPLEREAQAVKILQSVGVDLCALEPNSRRV